MVLIFTQFLFTDNCGKGLGTLDTVKLKICFNTTLLILHAESSEFRRIP